MLTRQSRAKKMADLEGAKNRLVDVLKERTMRYWELMKSWYRRRIAKEDFDVKAKALLGDSNVHLHNEFLFAILVKCQTGLQPSTEPQPMVANELPKHHLSPTSLPPPLSTRPHPSKCQRLISPPLESIPSGALDPLQYHTPPKVQLVGSDLDTLLLCSHELMLPDRPTLHTRMLLGAWEAGLDAVSEDAADLLQLALEVHLKNVLHTLAAHTASWQTRKKGQFQHSFGCSPSGCGLPRPHHAPILTSEEVMDTVPECGYEGDRREAATAMLAAQSGGDGSHPISLFNLRDALTLNRSSVPVHSVFSCCMERVLAGMWHPELEEEKQRQEVVHWQRNRVPLQLDTT